MRNTKLIFLMAVFFLFLSSYASEPKKEKNSLINVEDIIRGSGTPPEGWSGLDPLKYSDMSFYKRDGKTHLKGVISDYSSNENANNENANVIRLFTIDEFSGSEELTVGNIDADGKFEIDVPVNYPQFSIFHLGDVSKYLFLLPGDTLSIATCLATHPDPIDGVVPEYFGYSGEPDDGVAINLLADSLIIKRYSLDNLNSKYTTAVSDSMKSETYRLNARLGELLDSVITDLPILLGDIPISPFAKDILSTMAIEKIFAAMENLEINFRVSHDPSIMRIDGKDVNFSYDSLDLSKLLSTRLKHKDLIYNNPLLIFISPGFLKNCLSETALFRDAKCAALGYSSHPDGRSTYENPDVSEPYRISDLRLDSIGVGNCIAAQCVRTRSFIDSFKNKNSLLAISRKYLDILNPNGSSSNNRLERNNKLLTQLIKHNDSDLMNEILMKEYCNYIKDAIIEENVINIKSNPINIKDLTEREVLDKIISPHHGNYLFLDFWAITCGPCRAGMISQKSLLEQLADYPFKALYIANADENLEASKKWLLDEGIKGEHIFVSGDDWERLCGIFNVTSFPHGVLIDKDGEIIYPDYNEYPDRIKDYPELKKFIGK